MIDDKNNYLAYMLRLWQTRRDGASSWWFSLEDPISGNRHAFTDLESLLDYLKTQMESEPPDESSKRRRIIKMKAKSLFLVSLILGLIVVLSIASWNIIPGSFGRSREAFKELTFANVKGSDAAVEPAYKSGPWIYSGGPIGGLGYDVRMDPNNPDVMYVTDSWAGPFKSTDGGANWFPINNGITTRTGPSGDGIPIFSLTIDPNDSNRIWAGTQYSSAAYLSLNGGDSWTQLSNGIEETQLSIRGFTVEPGNSDVVYLAGEISSWEWNGSPLPGLGLDMTKGAVYKTTNGGQNWNKIWEGNNLARYIWIHPQNHDLIYVSTGIFDREAANSDPVNKIPGGEGILRSADGGQTWQVLNQANGFDPEELYFGSLYMHPTKPNILLAAAGNDPYGTALQRWLGGIYRTADGGDTWTEVLGDYNFSAVEICEGDPDVAYAGSLGGFFRSEDSGKTWIQVGPQAWGPPGIVAGFPIDIQCDPRDPMRLFVNNYGGGNFLSQNGGVTWEDSSRGYTGALMSAIAVSTQNPARVYATARSGVFGSYDGGKTWLGLSYDSARWMEMIALGVDPVYDGHVLISNADYGPHPLRSTNYGRSWTLLNTGLNFSPGNLMMRIEFAPDDPQLVYASVGSYACIGKGICDDVPAGGLIVSRDRGVTWMKTTLSTGSILGFDVFRGDGSLAFAAVVGDGLYRTDDSGVTWHLVNANPAPSPLGGALSAEGPVLTTLAVHPFNAEILYAGFWNDGVAVSRDGGVNWESSSAGMPPEVDVLDIVIDPTDPDVVYAGTHDSGVFYSLNGGETWKALNNGLRTRAVRDLALSEDGGVLYMASEGGGVFRLGTPQVQLKFFIPVVQKE